MLRLLACLAWAVGHVWVMQKGWVCIPIAAGLLLVAVIVALANRDGEPEHGGRKLSEWVYRYYYGTGPNAPEAEAAIREIGIKAAFPHLLKWVSYRTPRLKRELYG